MIQSRPASYLRHYAPEHYPRNLTRGMKTYTVRITSTPRNGPAGAEDSELIFHSLAAALLTARELQRAFDTDGEPLCTYVVGGDGLPLAAG
jgi:hypothetical protein